MFNVTNVVNLVIILLISSLASAAPDIPEISPIWKDYSTGSNNSESSGFVPPPPTVANIESNVTQQPAVLRAEIMPRSLQVQAGETITFTAESNQQNLRYYWKSGAQSSTYSDFSFNTSGLEPGKHRILLTVTNSDREQAHTFATVNIIVLNPSMVIAEPLDKPSITDSSAVVAPTPPVVAPIPPTVAPIPSVVEVVDKEVILPNLVGMSIAQAYAQLKKSKLVIGRIEERAVASTPGLIIEQSPAVGDKVAEESVVDIIVSIRAAIAVPDLYGLTLERAKAILARHKLILATVNERIDDTKVGLVIEQSPVASSSIEVGSSVVLTVGKQPVFAPKLSITASKLSLEPGEPLDLAVKLNPEYTDSTLVYAWKLGSYDGDQAVFKVKQVYLKPGQYDAQLTITNEQGETVTASQPITIVEASPVMPNVMGMTGTEAKASLSFVKSDKLIISTEEALVDHPQVVRQYPVTGQKITAQTEVRLVLAVPLEFELKITANQMKPMVGDVVQLSAKLSPEPKEANIHYIFRINNQPQAQVKSDYSWTPDAAGDYKLTVAAYSDEGLITQSLPITLTVAEKWDLPVATIVPTTQSVVQGESVEFSSASTYDIKSSLSYQWLSDTGARSQTKNFILDTGSIAEGSYTIRLQVTDSKNNTSVQKAKLVVKPAASGRKATPNVDLNTFTADRGLVKNGHTQKPIVNNNDQSKEIIFSLESTRKFVSTGEPVNFKIVSSSEHDAVQYFYKFDDGSVMQWGDEAQVSHKFVSFGTYHVRGGAKVDGKVYRTSTVSIWVWSSTLLYFVFGLALLLFLLMWWWTKHIPQNARSAKRSPIIVEDQVPLNDLDAVNTKRIVQAPSLVSTLLRGLVQLVIGLLISIVVIYFILKALGLS